MNQPILTYHEQTDVCVARAEVDQLVHPDEVMALSHSFRRHAADCPCRGFVLDLSRLTYMTSAALGMLINMHAHLKAAGCRFAIVVGEGLVANIFEQTHLDRVFPVRVCLDEAVKAVS
ncbi:MAG TPA: STAS domain-containing protein [Phycisphaerae bacterium]|nr:STAS domain-containing protein [Phycisphaerae bacterium]